MGIVHGNLRTRNFLLDLKTDSLRISEFGYAKYITAEGVHDELEQTKRLVYGLTTGDRNDTLDFDHKRPSDDDLKPISATPRSPDERDCGFTATTLRRHIDAWIAQRERLPAPRALCLVNFQPLDTATAASQPQESDGLLAEPIACSITWQRLPYREAYPGRTRQVYIHDHENITTDGIREESARTSYQKYPEVSCGLPRERFHEHNHSSYRTSDDDEVSTTSREYTPTHPCAKEQADENKAHQYFPGVSGENCEDGHLPMLSAVTRSHDSPQPRSRELKDGTLLQSASTGILAIWNADWNIKTEGHSKDIHAQHSRDSEAQATPETTRLDSAVTEVESPGTSPRGEILPEKTS
jgi:hypothetical protein